MTYKGTGWTRGDLGNVPDRNPFISCAECGESFKWQGYWEPRIVDGDRVDAPHSDEPWLCDDCHERQARLTRRRENNQKITEWCA